MAAQVAKQQVQPQVPEYQTVSSIPLLPRDPANFIKKGLIKITTEVERNSNEDSEEDDDDVIAVCVTKRKKEKGKSPYLSPNRDSYLDAGKHNPVVKAFIRDRKKFDPSWTIAAESVFSETHPFKQKRRNRSQEQPETQEKEQLTSRSSSESRCTSKKTQKRDATEFRKEDKSEDEVGEPRRQRQKRCNSLASVEREKPPPEIKEAIQPVVSPSTATSTTKETKSDSSKSGEDQKHNVKKKRVSLSMARQRHSTYITSERLLHIKSKVDAAIREHKVYSMTGHYSSVRRALRQRGWVEKIDSDLKGRRRTHRFEDIVEEASYHLASKRDSSEGNENHCQAEAEIVNRMLRNINEDLCWLSKPYPYCWKDMGKCDMVNRLPKAYFSNKVGLCNSLANMQWYFEPGVCSTQFPRTYNISMRDEYESFKDDFRLTACISTLKWLTVNYKKGGETAVRTPDGRVDVSIIEFALRRCGEYVKYKEHDDIDMLEVQTTWEHQWDHFLTQYYKIVNEGHLLRENKEDPPTLVIVSKAQTMVNLLQPYWPQMDIEGINNFWIVKPGGRCCGNGIFIRNHLEQIMDIVNPSITRETRYVVQKYIERPLLIYNTKFDIRQWFLVTNVYPLTIWMYKESYLRFCSTTFSLKNTHESIHLCNNAVQRRYKNGKRDRNLPDENMWDCYTFQTYLKAIGYPNVWDEVIYPGMKESFVGALLASQDNMERRRNCFELYGADFMVSEQLTDGPWLIEINSNPAMDSSTSVTARMCPQVLEDIVKVVIDRRNDRNASTGAFEMVFKQNCPPIPPYLGMSLSIRGKKVYKSPSESKNLRRPKYQQPASESDSSESSGEEVDIVQKRCTNDFMQPIKTLREEIQRLGTARSKEELLSVRDDFYSDSAADTDTSRASTDRRIALEGKEIELKKKKIRKRRHKVAQKLENKFRYRMDPTKPDLASKKEEIALLKKRNADKKTDWVRKNIENIRGYNVGRLFDRPQLPENDELSFLQRSQDNLDIYKDYILSGQCFDEYKASNKNSNNVLELLFREEILKMLDAAEARDLHEDKIHIKSAEKPDEKRDEVESSPPENDAEPRKGPLIVAGLWEPMNTNNEEPSQGSKEETDAIEIQREPEAPKTARTSRKEYLMVEGLNIGRGSYSDGPSRAVSCTSLNFETDRCSFTLRDPSDYEETQRSSNKSINSLGVPEDDDFDPKLEKEFIQAEGYDKSVHNGDFTNALSIKAPGLTVKERGKIHRRQNTKTSMEYFKEWKFKIDETRRNCEDMLTKLRHFKENNSKIKFQDVLQRRIEEEARILRKMKQYKLTKYWGVMEQQKKVEIKNERVKVNGEHEKPQLPKEARPKMKHQSIKDFTQKIYVANLRLKENRAPATLSNPEETPLAINSESGAVRSVNEVLPKVKLRNRPLLPNGASGRCRNVDQKKILIKNKQNVGQDLRKV